MIHYCLFSVHYLFIIHLFFFTFGRINGFEYIFNDVYFFLIASIYFSLLMKKSRKILVLLILHNFWGISYLVLGKLKPNTVQVFLWKISATWLCCSCHFLHPAAIYFSGIFAHLILRTCFCSAVVSLSVMVPFSSDFSKYWCDFALLAVLSVDGSYHGGFV